MDEESITQFIKEIQGPNREIVKEGEWLMIPCPLAEWKHEKGTDSSPSFGIHIEDDDESYCHCFTCKTKGPLDYLLTLLEGYTGDSYRRLKREVESNEMYALRLPEWDKRKSAKTSKKAELGEPIDELLVDVYDPACDHPYLATRGVLPCTTEELDLRVDPDNRGAERILFPVRTPDGRFYGYTGRATGKEEPKVRDYLGMPKKLMLLGSQYIDTTKHRYVILVEGLFDFAILFQLGYPVVATMFSSLTPEQAAILLEFGLPVMVFFDNDTAGVDGGEVVYTTMAHHVPVLSVTYPTKKTIRVKKNSKRKRVPKDPGELTDDQIDYMIGNADLMAPPVKTFAEAHIDT